MPILTRLRQNEVATPDSPRLVRNVTVAAGGLALAAGLVTDGRLMLAGMILLVVGISGSRLSLDPPSMVMAFCGLTLLIPSRLVFTPLGAIGTPALLMGLGMLALWGTSRIFSSMEAPTSVTRCGCSAR